MNAQPGWIVLATATAKTGAEKALLDALLEVAEPTRAQPGCVSFELLRATDNPNVVTAIERWASKAAHDRHLQGAHVARLMAAMEPLLAGAPSLVAYETAG